MANIKRVEITGVAPFNLYENETMQPMLAFLAGPTSGLRLEWLAQAGTIPSKHGGQTTMYRFRLHGEEAVSWPWLDLFYKTIAELGGEIRTSSARDIEGDTG